VGKLGKKWPESELAVQMPCNPVTLCRNLRTLEGLNVSQCPVLPILYAAIAVYYEPPVALREEVTGFFESTSQPSFPGSLPSLRSAVCQMRDLICAYPVRLSVPCCMQVRTMGRETRAGWSWSIKSGARDPSIFWLQCLMRPSSGSLLVEIGTLP
jgi:hypothetical protein